LTGNLIFREITNTDTHETKKIDNIKTNLKFAVDSVLNIRATTGEKYNAEAVHTIGKSNAKNPRRFS